MTPRTRTRLESFRQQQEQSKVLSPQTSAAIESAQSAIPSLALNDLRANAAVPGSPRASARGALSSRRLKKEVLCGDSHCPADSNSAGHVHLDLDGSGTPRAVHVVQQESSEDMNMVSVKWLWSVGAATHQIELRRGRLSGIRKLYVDRKLVFRSKNLADMISDRGSTHKFDVGGLPSEARAAARIEGARADRLEERPYARRCASPAAARAASATSSSSTARRSSATSASPSPG